MIDDTRLEGREIDGKVYVLFEEVVLPMLNRRDNEIERLREILTIMIPHIEHMVCNAEDAKQVDTDFIRNRLYDARAALGEGKE